ncbi:hypothetical protein M407DRAFT_5284 [Tulasnella calospora MUT 4182]|uniref:Uncharacterized protein n=1 Tax=Tulasnella calospora MUT 4182 TaxID=1051891 RepID=A0A0C3LB01_9AGAM|nr:hypothetical protein M407DRAFT_5284 [Tulasnella calospora MUT 4182]
MAPITVLLNKRSKDSNPDAIDTLNNSINAGNYVGLALTILVVVVLVGTIIFSVRKRRLRRAQEEIKKQTGESNNAIEIGITLVVPLEYAPQSPDNALSDALKTHSRNKPPSQRSKTVASRAIAARARDTRSASPGWLV